MLTIEKVDTTKKAQVRRFIDLPFRLYKDCPQWVPFSGRYHKVPRKKGRFLRSSWPTAG